MKVANFMIPLKDLVHLPEDSTVDEVSQMMLNSHIGSVIITKKTEDKTLALGLITKTDLVRIYTSGKENAGKDKIGPFLKKKIVIVSKEEERVKVAEFMIKNGFHHILVGNESNQIVGMVSSLDVAREFVEDDKDTVRSIYFVLS